MSFPAENTLEDEGKMKGTDTGKAANEEEQQDDGLSTSAKKKMQSSARWKKWWLKNRVAYNERRRVAAQSKSIKRKSTPDNHKDDQTRTSLQGASLAPGEHGFQSLTKATMSKRARVIDGFEDIARLAPLAPRPTTPWAQRPANLSLPLLMPLPATNHLLLQGPAFEQTMLTAAFQPGLGIIAGPVMQTSVDTYHLQLLSRGIPSMHTTAGAYRNPFSGFPI